MRAANLSLTFLPAQKDVLIAVQDAERECTTENLFPIQEFIKDNS